MLNTLNKTNLEINDYPINTAHLTKLLKHITDNTISNKITKQIFDKL
jgi:Asp-tRNAAsn/Glu-tRNAGln amidotransferase B subunit (PET112 homolog)